ncbi:MAG: N-ethylammeline chlorohydrolase, partial [Calditrichaeota bacterium]
MGILLKNGLIITQNSQRDVLPGDILVEKDCISSIGKNISLNGHEVIDLAGRVVAPGFIQSHIHLCQTIFRNLSDDLELMDWLEKIIWPLENAHDESSLAVSAQLGLAELMLGGTTAVLDMGNGRHQEVIFREMFNSGIRGFSGLVMMDRGNQAYQQKTGDTLETTEELIHEWHHTVTDRIGYALAPRFVPSCSLELWKGVRNLAEKYGLIIHTHSSENRKEWQLVKEQTGYSNIEFFVRQDLAAHHLCLAHCIWVSEEETEMLRDYGIHVLHCPSANLKLGSGIAPVPEFLRNDINVSLGSDGASCNNNMDIFQEMRLAALIQKPRAGVTSITAQNVYDMATLGGAKALGLENKIGSLEEGKKADLIVLDLNKVHTIPADDI